MDEQTLAQLIAEKVASNTEFSIAIIGLVGAVVGSLLTIAGNIFLHWLQDRKRDALDAARKNLLKEMLKDREWRKLRTLSRVIGADEDTTRRLLIELKARGSEIISDDGVEVWGLISKHPLNKIA